MSDSKILSSFTANHNRPFFRKDIWRIDITPSFLEFSNTSTEQEHFIINKEEISNWEFKRNASGCFRFTHNKKIYEFEISDDSLLKLRYWVSQPRDTTWTTFPSKKQIKEELKKQAKIKKVSDSINGKWQIQLSDGELVEYASGYQLEEMILAGKIRPDDKARKIQDSQGKEVKIDDWKPLSQTLARSSFHLRVLFQPVWAHTFRGAGIGARIGVLLWLAQAVWLFLNKETWAVSFWLSAILLFWIRPFLGEFGKETLKAEYALGGIGAISFTLSKLAKHQGLSIWKGIPIALQFQFGATVAGAILGVFPGMIIGTIVGRLRLNSLKKSPHAIPEKQVYVRGILIPAILFVVVLTLYIQLIDWFSANYGPYSASSPNP